MLKLSQPLKHILEEKVNYYLELIIIKQYVKFEGGKSEGKQYMVFGIYV